MITKEQYSNLYHKSKCRGLKFKQIVTGVKINGRQFYTFDVANDYVIEFPLKVTPSNYEEQIYLVEVDNEDE